MHTTCTPENVSATPVAVLNGPQLSLLEDSPRAPVLCGSRTSAPAEHPPLPQRTELDSGELAPELVNEWHEACLARCALDELLERGVLAGLFG